MESKFKVINKFAHYDFLYNNQLIEEISGREPLYRLISDWVGDAWNFSYHKPENGYSTSLIYIHNR